MLIYAHDGGSALRHIDEVQGTHDTSQFRCPQCKGPLIPHFRGTIVTPHFKHRPGANCAAAGGEGAWHLSAKLHLDRVIAEMSTKKAALLVSISCPCGRASNQPMVSFEPDDEVILEKSIGDFRPDLVVYRGSAELVRIEVVVSNPCDQQKWERLKHDRVPLLEVRAEAILPEPGKAGTVWWGTEPLAFDRGISLPEPPRCEGCIEREKKAEEERIRLANKEMERERTWRTPRRVILAIGTCYTYYKSGKRGNPHFYLWGIVSADEVEEAWLVSGKKELGKWAPLSHSELRRNASNTISLWTSQVFQEKKRIVFKIEPSRLYFFYETLRPSLEKEALQAFQAARPLHWWDSKNECWVRAYPQSLAEDILKPFINSFVVNKWAREGRLKTRLLQAFQGARKTRVFPADDIDRWRSWFEKNRSR